MKRYRIGKDVANRINVRTNGEYTPLAGRDISLQMTDPKGCKTWENFTIVDDYKMLFVFYGKGQKHTGTYQLTVWENYGNVGQTAVDCIGAFRLVVNTTLEGGEDPEGLDTEVNDLELDISTAEGGTGGDTNVIEIVKVNGTALTPDSNKAVDVPVPTALSGLTDDSTHRTVTDTEKSNWNSKSDFSGSYNDLADKPTIPTVPSNVSAFTNDSHYVASTAITTIVSMTQAQYDALATKDANTLYVIV